MAGSRRPRKRSPLPARVERWENNLEALTRLVAATNCLVWQLVRFWLLVIGAVGVFFPELLPIVDHLSGLMEHLIR